MVLQTTPLPLGYGAVLHNANEKKCFCLGMANTFGSSGTVVLLDYQRSILMFQLPKFIKPDFTHGTFAASPDVKTEKAGKGFLPHNFYATTIFPEYSKIKRYDVLRHDRDHGRIV